MKKSPILLSIFFTLISCGSKVPKEIQEFLSQAVLTKPETVKSGHFTQEVNEVVGGQTGKSTIVFNFHYESSSDFGFDAVYHYDGIKIQEGVIDKTIKLEFISNDEYKLTKIINSDETSELLDRKKAYEDYYYKIFDNGANPYRYGGLYYGDLISVKANRFFPYYTIDENKEHLTYEQKGVIQSYEGVILDQTIVIDNKGMLTSSLDHAVGIDVPTDTADMVQSATYVYY